MFLLDSHAHLSMPQFDNDRREVIQRARDKGLVAIVSLATKKEEFAAEIELSLHYPDYIWTSLGFHPHEAQAV
ncbi:MAG: TatD family hydrolase, partial [bacterium]